MLAPLRARAQDARRRRPVSPDPLAVGLASEFDGVPSNRFDDIATVLRGAVFDHWVREFLDAHPGGTVVELGAGLNTRAERLAGRGGGRVDATWVDVDLPAVAELRRELLPGTERRLVAGSVLDEDWLDVAREMPAPYLLVSESVLTLLPEQGVQRIVFTAGSILPGATLLTDTIGRTTASYLERSEPLSSGSLTFDWTCEDPAELQPWGLRLLESRNVAAVPDAVSRALSPAARARATALRMTSRLRGHNLARYELLAP
ncbi:class I SAM-dependent methyltransferase [Pseudonocardia endophytica]|uniref:O-methyltransferase involved in polyketide biosynthesis n=1 Tax=Pseudonocardia endophytica TaxID=401976 RepID=A0A4R1HHC5_PSEEN|nr:class I SAM-dependent methyltransferase [Pseudonocardia endophytica]TCK20271.1 O-methyltransferase involved in polyketide biosynthesis [Pseudonocardia endophytica]